MKAPRIYGSEARCKAAVAGYINRGEDLLDQAIGVRKQVAAEEARQPKSLIAFAIEADWAKDVRRWFINARYRLERYLQDQMEEYLPVLTLGLPPDTGKPRHWIGLDNGEPWLRNAVEELREFRGVLGVRRNVAEVGPAPARFEELHASGLVAANVINDRAKEMLAPHTPRQLYNAIGSAKALTEATLRAALERLGEPYKNRDDLPALMKKWRAAVGKLAPPDPEGEATLDLAHNALANLVTFLAEWRNAYGSGHGRSEYPPGLKVRHARLAADAAETCIRFIVTTMDDFERLPP